MSGQDAAVRSSKIGSEPKMTLVPSQVVQSNEISSNVENNAPKNKRNLRRRPKKQPVGNKVKDDKSGKEVEEADKSPKSTTLKHKKPQRKKKSKDARKRFPWRKHIKQDVVDPISLEPLVSLPYPPFALAIEKPYTVIPVWPQKEDQESPKEDYKKEDEQKRQQRIIAEQWGSKISPKECTEFKNNGEIPGTERCNGIFSTKLNEHVHLFDGKVLAYYLVSQLQFIDPLNRRDLTREEIMNLDAYLKRNKIKHNSVLEAYDSKGITLNRAGISGQTRAGRAEILQQEAQVLLNALFQDHRQRGRNAARTHSNHGQEVGNQFSRQYAAFETNNDTGRRRRNRRQHRNHISTNSDVPTNVGVFSHDGGGMTIIDDNMNPGLRGVNRIPDDTDFTMSQQLASHGTRNPYNRIPLPESFPALMSTSINCDDVTEHDIANNNWQMHNKKEDGDEPKVVSKSLLKIANIVKKTNREDIEKQKKARKEALRKMELANLPYEAYLERRNNSDSTSDSVVDDTIMSIATTGFSAPTAGQIERNRNLAYALDVMPSTMRQVVPGIHGGWKRPTHVVDEFGKELEEVQYPDALIKEAKERMQELLKLEKKWIAFLQDDTAASCSLKKMDRATRIFVHTYSDFWYLHTHSYDPEPRRYIHCMKIRETIKPHPLLSIAAKKWKGPALTLPQHNISFQHQLAPSNQQQSQLNNDKSDLFLQFSNNSTLINTSEHLASNHEVRQKLILEPRTKPLNKQPPFQLSKNKTDEEKQKIIEDKKLKALQKRNKEERRQQLLAAAFDSNDELSSSDSDWDVGEAVFPGREEE